MAIHSIRVRVNKIRVQLQTHSLSTYKNQRKDKDRYTYRGLKFKLIKLPAYQVDVTAQKKKNTDVT
jgi:hypothetical protein